MQLSQNTRSNDTKNVTMIAKHPSYNEQQLELDYIAQPENLFNLQAANLATKSPFLLLSETWRRMSEETKLNTQRRLCFNYGTQKECLT